MRGVEMVKPNEVNGFLNLSTSQPLFKHFHDAAHNSKARSNYTQVIQMVEKVERLRTALKYLTFSDLDLRSQPPRAELG